MSLIYHNFSSFILHNYFVLLITHSRSLFILSSGAPSAWRNVHASVRSSEEKLWVMRWCLCFAFVNCSRSRSFLAVFLLRMYAGDQQPQQRRKEQGVRCALPSPPCPACPVGCCSSEAEQVWHRVARRLQVVLAAPSRGCRPCSSITRHGWGHAAGQGHPCSKGSCMQVSAAPLRGTAPLCKA